MSMTPLEAETVVIETLRAERDKAVKAAEQAAREMSAIGPLIERAQKEAESLRLRHAALAETKSRAEALAAAYAAAIERNTPASTREEPAEVPADSPTQPQTPTPVRPYVQQAADPRDRCANCGDRVIWDEQNGFSHDGDGTPAGGLCERRWSA